jgi:hypothetical protein
VYLEAIPCRSGVWNCRFRNDLFSPVGQQRPCRCCVVVCHAGAVLPADAMEGWISVSDRYVTHQISLGDFVFFVWRRNCGNGAA